MSFPASIDKPCLPSRISVQIGRQRPELPAANQKKENLPKEKNYFEDELSSNDLVVSDSIHGSLFGFEFRVSPSPSLLVQANPENDPTSLNLALPHSFLFKGEEKVKKKKKTFDYRVVYLLELSGTELVPYTPQAKGKGYAVREMPLSHHHHHHTTTTFLLFPFIFSFSSF